jgi:hypothetical protein
VIDGRGSVSPDTIKTYRIALIDLQGAGGDEQDMFNSTFGNAFAFLAGDLFDVQQRTYAVYTTSFVTLTFGWDRVDYDQPGTLVRDPVGIELDVSDYAGATASDITVLTFPQVYSSESRADCPKGATPPAMLTVAALTSRVLSFVGSGSKAAVGVQVSCHSGSSCTEGVTVTTAKLTVCKACAAAAVKRKPPKPIVIARGVFTTPAHHTKRVSAPLTTAGRRAVKLLTHGGALKVTVTVTTVGVTGKTITHRYSKLLRGARRG